MESMKNKTIRAQSENSDMEKKFERFIDYQLLQNRTVLISEGVSSKLTKKVLGELLVLDQQDPESEIKVFLNTPGGSADDGFAIFDTIRMLRAPVKIICTGLVASAGTIILCASSQENRISLPNTRIMMHQPSSGFMGTASDIEINAEEILKLRNRANEVISEATGQPVEKIAKDINRDFWLSPTEAEEYGLIGRVVDGYGDI